MSYLRIFDPEQGTSEVELTSRHIKAGRKSNTDLLLDHPSVSRHHATFLKEGDGYIVEDATSKTGTYVNGKRIARHSLEHGDTIQMALFVMEYRTDDDANTTSLHREGDSPVERMMRKNFRHLPSGIRARYRTLGVDPDMVFAPGDTLAVGGGGVLLPAAHPPQEGSCLELEFTWPNGKTRTLMAEVIAVLPAGRSSEICIKLHQVNDSLHFDVLTNQRRGSWTEVPAK